MGLINNNGNGGTYGHRTQTTLSEINVTPLVDVMLVLLIVFMISAPLMTQGIQVDLPKTKSQTLDESQEPVILIIKQDQKILINKNEISYQDLHTKLSAIYENKQNKEIFVQADQAVPYGFVAKVMGEIKISGITKVGLVTEPPTKPGE